ncbi:ABC transporter permease [Paraburkholderia rhynchosiae]|uniref:ABC transporter permease n=1 Tax=Paraburkholderia rhynchosiae TaxID=487049 RepID=A0A2N7WLJ8_9BURK|nr:ABC transporter permease [Paraburkholderia rhynchosiae]PMS30329.1 ABC transporter permease [Paraburkholderia rhynchosiae]CAB3691348.1 L-arabinose transport system permease protein AraH [Paraburkholderia rhynchosiae]
MEQSQRLLNLAIRLVLLVGMPVIFGLCVDHYFSQANLYAIFQAFAFLGIIALGLSVTMIAGEFDLSIAAISTVAGLITVKFGGDSAMLGILYAIIFGVVVGIANAALLPWLGVSSLVTTVGSMMFLTGVGYWIAGGRVLSYANLDVSDFLDQNVGAIFSPRSLITIVCFVVVSLFLRYTTLGRDIYASGGHRKAAIQSGARVGKALTVGFVVSGGLSALGGGLLSLSLATASATMGSNILLQAASAAIVGGVALGGGIGSPLGVAMGVLILTVLNNGLGLLNATSTQILLVNGLLLLIVVLLDGRLGAVLASPLERLVRRKTATAA